MALSVALPVRALETDNFDSFSPFGHIIDLKGLSQSQTSPSPSASSESSGIGSFESLKSDSLASNSIPPSPQTTEKKIFEDIVPVKPLPKELDCEDVKIYYGGRDILNLEYLKTRWNYCATYLPLTGHPDLFLLNRSQYHRLLPFGEHTQYVHDTCRHCGFTWVVGTIG